MSKKTKTEARTMTERQRDQAIQHANTLRFWRKEQKQRPILLRAGEVGHLMLILGHKDANKLYFDFNNGSKVLAVYLNA